jgi:hypothetical protein
MLETRALLSAMSAQVTTDQPVYQPGQPIEMTFIETNTSKEPVQVAYGPVNDGFNVTQNGKLIWQSNGGVNPQYLIEATLKPGQSLTLHATWNGEDSQGIAADLAGGTFTVTNQLNPQGASATFQIEPALSTGVRTSQPVNHVGQPVNLTFIETNTSSVPVVVLPSGTFTITNAATNVAVFSQSVGQSTAVTLQPGKSLTETATWTATEPGNYGLSYQNSEVETYGTFQVVQPSTPTNPPAQNPDSGTGGTGTTGQNPQPGNGGGSTGQNPQPGTGGTGGPVQDPQQVTMTLATNRQVYGPSQPIDIALTLKNTSGQTIVISPSIASDGFTALSGSTVVWHTVRTTRVVRAKARTLLPGQSVTFQTVWNFRPSPRGRGAAKMSPHSYTILASEGGYSAQTTIQIG